MYNAVNKLFIIIVLALIATSCGSSADDQARQLSEAAQHELSAGNYEAAIVILDTLDVHYANQVDVRRSAMKYRAMAVEGLTMKRIAVVDDTLAVLKSALDAAEANFDYVENPGKGLGGNFIYKPLVGKSEAILPRINDDGYLTLSVTVPQRAIGFTNIAFGSDNASTVTTPIESSRLVNVEGREMVVLNQEEVAYAIEWLARNPDVMTYRLVGKKGSVNGKLTPTLRDALIATLNFALDKQAYRLALIEREKLERKLQLTRDQLSNLLDQ